MFEEMDYNPTYENVFQDEYKEIRLKNRRVVCAACKIGETIIAGARHFDTVMRKQLDVMSFDKEVIGDAEQGFIDNFGIFLSREDAFILAKEKGQIKNKPNIPGVLFSEDLY